MRRTERDQSSAVTPASSGPNPVPGHQPAQGVGHDHDLPPGVAHNRRHRTTEKVGGAGPDARRALDAPLRRSGWSRSGRAPSRPRGPRRAPRCRGGSSPQTQTALAELLTADHPSLDLVAFMVDGVHFGEHTCVVALGIDINGVKHALSLVEGSTENATLVTELIVGLRERGLDVDPPGPGRARWIEGAASRGARRVRPPGDRSLSTPQDQERRRSSPGEATKPRRRTAGSRTAAAARRRPAASDARRGNPPPEALHRTAYADGE